MSDEVICLLDSSDDESINNATNIEIDKGSSIQQMKPTSGSSYGKTRQSLTKVHVPITETSKHTVASKRDLLVDLPRHSDTDDSDEDDFLNLPVFNTKSTVYKTQHGKSQSSKTSGLGHETHSTEHNDDIDSVHASRSLLHAKTDSSGDEICYSNNLPKNNVSKDMPTTKDANAKQPSKNGTKLKGNDDDMCIILSSDDESVKNSDKPSSEDIAVENGVEVSTESKAPASRRTRPRISYSIDSDSDDDDDLPLPAPFQTNQASRSENDRRRKRDSCSYHSSPELDNGTCADLREVAKSSKKTNTQSPRGALKDDRNYETDGSSPLQSPRGALKDDKNYESDGSPPLQSSRGALKDDKHNESDETSSLHLISEVQKNSPEKYPVSKSSNTFPSSIRVGSSPIVLDSDSDIDTSPLPPSRVVQKPRPKAPIQNPYKNTSARSALRIDDSDIFTPPNATLPPRIQHAPYTNTSDNDAGMNSFQLNDLISPRASIGRVSTGSAATTNSRRKIKVPIPAIPVRITKEIGGKLYPDFKNHFIRALIKYAKVARRAVYTKGALDGSIRAINTIALYPFPIRSAEATKSIQGVGDDFVQVLKESEKEVKKTNPPYNPPADKFSSAAAAALVVLYRYEQGKEGEDRFLSMEGLIQRINLKAHNAVSGSGVVFDRAYDYYLSSNNLDPSWIQIKKLCSSDYIKVRSRKKACESGCVYELLEDGRREAIQLVNRIAQGAVPDGPLRQLGAHRVPEEFGNVTIAIDGREGGGGSRKLHDFCEFMDLNEVPYFVRNLKISDYAFFVGNKLAPVLIERKSIEDVAHSLFDGRWESQQKRMRKAQYVLGGGDARKCQLCYLIEGDVDKTIAHGGFVGRSNHRKSVEDVKTAIAGLPGLGFSVMTTKTKRESLSKIKQVAQDYLWKHNNGSIDCTHTYDQFVNELKNVDDAKGDPPTDPLHKNPAPPIYERGPMDTNPIAGGNIPVADTEETREKREELMKLSLTELKSRCRERTEKMTGSKIDLVERLLQKRKPEIIISRCRRKEYLPKVPSCNAAILVALHLHHVPGEEPLEKAKIMSFAEETGVSKDPMFGNGKGWYDGWSGIKDLTDGDPSLVAAKFKKRTKRYWLTTQPPGSSGVEVARAIHIMAHRQNLCRCGQHVEDI